MSRAGFKKTGVMWYTVHMKNEVHGNVAGIRDTVLAQMKTLYDMPTGADTFLTGEMADALAYFTQVTGREVLVYLSRAGEVKDVRIGDDRSVHMEEIRLVRNLDRLCGVRCIHTHPDGSGLLSDVDMGSLSALRLDAMAAIGVRDGRAADVYAGFLGEMEEGQRKVVLLGPMRAHRLPQKQLMEEIREADARLTETTYAATAAQPERAVLCGIEGGEGYDSMAELAALCETAGLTVVARETQRRRTPDGATYIGAGKADDLSLTCSAAEADMVVFDDELSPVQMRNLEGALGLPIIDRTMLILDIFAKRAQSREGKLQVELAQLQYRLPRLLGMGRVLSRQGASGVGMRGPGEKKLEIDRRRIRRRIFELQQELNEIEKQRSLRREKRASSAIPKVALVGYTNAGKSTLLNTLSGSDALAEDMLFATLDPLLRRVTLPNGMECIVSDTVGFINKLPHELVDAFRSTLEEVRQADLILHVIDLSSPYCDVQMRVVEDVLSQLSALDTPRIEVFNKTDRTEAIVPKRPNAVGVSAATGAGMDALLTRIEQALDKRSVRVELLVPYDKYEAMRFLRENGVILAEEHTEEGTRVTANMTETELWRVRNALK